MIIKENIVEIIIFQKHIQKTKNFYKVNYGLGK